MVVWSAGRFTGVEISMVISVIWGGMVVARRMSVCFEVYLLLRYVALRDSKWDM